MDSRLDGVYVSTKEWLQQYYGDEDKINKIYKELLQEPTDFSKKPNSVEKKRHWKFDYTAKTSPPAAYVVKVKNGRVTSYNGAIITPDNHLLWDVSIEFWADNPINHYLLYSDNIPDREYTNEKIAALTFCASQYYYHWLFDVLPRLYLLRFMGVEVDKYAINWNGRPGFQDETLDLLEFDKRKILTVTENTNLQAKELYVPSLPGYTGHMGKWTVDFLRNELMPAALQQAGIGKTPKRIYISRGNAITRNVVNEDWLIPFLEKHGFTTVYLEKMTVAEQIRMFNQAEIIIGAHGGGLSNLAFCQPGTKVVEIFSPNYVHTCYWVLSQHVGADYYYLLGSGERPPKHVDPNAVHQHIHVDQQEMEKMLGKLL